jgi:S1-C subfamily serine protease
MRLTNRVRLTTILAILAVSSGAVQSQPAPERPSGGWIGVWLVDAVDGGARIVAVVQDGPASRAGLEAGDVIVEAEQRPVVDQQELARHLAGVEIGGELALRVLRGGQSMTLAVRVEQRRMARPARPAVALPPVAPAPDPQANTVRYRLQSTSRVDSSGLQVADVTPVLREHFGAPRDAGVLVVGVEPERGAAKAGVQVGDVLVRIGTKAIVNRRQLEQALRGRKWTESTQVFVVRDGERHEFTFPTGGEATSGPGPEPDRELLERRLQLEVQRLERRLAEIHTELRALREQD